MRNLREGVDMGMVGATQSNLCIAAANTVLTVYGNLYVGLSILWCVPWLINSQGGS